MRKSADPPSLPARPRRSGRPPAAPERPLRRNLNRDAIVDAALLVLDAEGLEAVTMRRVADQLGTGPSSLYAHVADKEAMVDAVLDRVIGEVPVPASIEPENWEAQLKDMLRSSRAAFARHRDIARASLANIPTGERALPVTESLMGILLAGGVGPRVAALSIDILALYVTATAFEESLEDYGGEQDADPPFHLELRRFFAALPADRFPNLVAMAEPMTSGDRDERFEFGLELLVRGIAASADAARPPE